MWAGIAELRHASGQMLKLSDCGILTGYDPSDYNGFSNSQRSRSFGL
jgi:hypothetical protein